ncbi:bifunctional riboflavin kinase/FAD synthetase [Marinisporobacter balticus]|uniref:Riboflavin biosynthesis protein n=1 Tax=Marinisporobacter balticus TaxID=2018667 RepID=A0A4R2L7B7_9FIRM|nr:bifunctional riboflavin kinase/FAD synthetase [Marinisporobacter balticus]TCO79896.1 FMN adenylyltransferase /riboflavin kinase [Marinisporobacter balticus]
MEIITSLENLSIDGNTGIALGSFDGVHMGHQALIVNLVENCKRKGLRSIVYTFKNHPRKLTSVSGAPKKIISDKKKFEILAQLGVDYTVYIAFDDYQRNLAPENFIKEVLKDKLKMSYGIVGFDYHFGYKAKGDTTRLNDLKDKYGYDLMVVKAIKIQEEVVSSTKIREFIKDGNMGKVNLFLGRNYSITGEVVRGNGFGKEFGFPTANISVSEAYILPSIGVYITKTIVDNKCYYSVTNVGYNPTIGNTSIRIETHILDFNEELYGKEIEVIFFQKSRDESKFETIHELIDQIHKDIERVKKFFSIGYFYLQ